MMDKEMTLDERKRHKELEWAKKRHLIALKKEAETEERNNKILEDLKKKDQRVVRIDPKKSQTL